VLEHIPEDPNATQNMPLSKPRKSNIPHKGRNRKGARYSIVPTDIVPRHNFVDKAKIKRTTTSSKK
jgi:hypothetical protein